MVLLREGECLGWGVTSEKSAEKSVYSCFAFYFGKVWLNIQITGPITRAQCSINSFSLVVCVYTEPYQKRIQKLPFQQFFADYITIE